MSIKHLAVTPVVDYEPPPRAVGHRWPTSPIRQQRTAQRPTGDRPKAALSPVLRSAGAFADAALRRVLEVIDRRRPLGQLRPLLTAGLVDSVLSLSPAAAGSGGAATLRRVRLQPVGPEDPPAAVEVFASYTRGRRTHALACRVQREGPEARWQIVALHIG